jgi:hypothetical protein
VHRLKGDRDAAESHFTQAIEIARGQSANLFELRAAVSVARLATPTSSVRCWPMCSNRS